MKPLFMWAGGKSKLIKHYEPYLPQTFECYHEPFFGGGAMFIWAYEKNPNAKFYINDVNPHIVQIYKAIYEIMLTNFVILWTHLKRHTYLWIPQRKDK